MTELVIKPEEKGILRKIASIVLGKFVSSYWHVSAGKKLVFHTRRKHKFWFISSNSHWARQVWNYFQFVALREKKSRNFSNPF